MIIHPVKWYVGVHSKGTIADSSDYTLGAAAT